MCLWMIRLLEEKKMVVGILNIIVSKNKYVISKKYGSFNLIKYLSFFSRYLLSCTYLYS